MLANDPEEEYEEQLVYLNFEGMDSMVELFSQNQSNFLVKESASEFHGNDPRLLDPNVVNSKSGLVWNENLRMAHCKKQKLNDNVLLKIHNLESDMPVLQIGNRYFTGRSKPSLGTQLFFQKNTSSTSGANGADQPSTSSSSIRGSKQLQSLLNQNPNANGGIQSIPKDELFTPVAPTESYDLVAKTDKVISFNLRMSENRPHLRQQYFSQETCAPLDISDEGGQSMKSRNQGDGRDHSKRISNLRKMIAGTYVKRRSPFRKRLISQDPSESSDHPEIEIEPASPDNSEDQESINDL